MRSARRGSATEQATLPFAVERLAERRRTASPAATTEARSRTRHRMTDDAMASAGWPAGTVLLLERRRPQRGEPVVALVRDRRLVGTFGLELGRVAVRNDRGSVWLGPDAEILGVVIQADPPLPA